MTYKQMFQISMNQIVKIIAFKIEQKKVQPPCKQESRKLIQNKLGGGVIKGGRGYKNALS